jgi:hypothetical protein
VATGAGEQTLAEGIRHGAKGPGRLRGHRGAPCARKDTKNGGEYKRPSLPGSVSRQCRTCPWCAGKKKGGA